MPGGDEARVNFLTTALGLQLVGRAGLTASQQALVKVSRRNITNIVHRWVDVWVCIYNAIFSKSSSHRNSSSRDSLVLLGSKSYSGQYSRLSRGRPGFNSPFRRIFLRLWFVVEVQVHISLLLFNSSLLIFFTLLKCIILEEKEKKKSMPVKVFGGPRIDHDVSFEVYAFWYVVQVQVQVSLLLAAAVCLFVCSVI